MSCSRNIGIALLYNVFLLFHINIPYCSILQVNKSLVELIKASQMKKKPTDWTNLTMEDPGIQQVRNFLLFQTILLRLTPILHNLLSLQVISRGEYHLSQLHHKARVMPPLLHISFWKSSTAVYFSSSGFWFWDLSMQEELSGSWNPSKLGLLSHNQQPTLTFRFVDQVSSSQSSSLLNYVKHRSTLATRLITVCRLYSFEQSIYTGNNEAVLQWSSWWKHKSLRIILAACKQKLDKERHCFNMDRENTKLLIYMYV